MGGFPSQQQMNSASSLLTDILPVFKFVLVPRTPVKQLWPDDRMSREDLSFLIDQARLHDRDGSAAVQVAGVNLTEARGQSFSDVVSLLGRLKSRE